MYRLLTITSCAIVVAACGSQHASTASTQQTTASNAPSPSTESGGGTSGGPLIAEAQSAAAGDIPDNQVFLTYRDAATGYQITYPEGWAIARRGTITTIQDKNNLIRIDATSAAAPSTQSIAADMQQLRSSEPTLTSTPADASPSCQNGSKHPKVARATFHVVYHTQSAPSPVTGKRATLDVDRYYYPHAGTVAVVDFGTPRGVDNVDAYCQMAASFRWK